MLIDPEDYGHFFDVLTHLNFAGAAFLSFFYGSIHQHLSTEFSSTASELDNSNDMINRYYGQKVNPNDSKKNFDNAKKWRSAQNKVTILRPIVKWTIKRLNQIHTEEDYIIKYLPFFIYSGLFCLTLLFLGGYHHEIKKASVKPPVHICDVYEFRLIITSIAVLLSTMFVLYKKRSLLKLLVIHFFLVLFWILATIYGIELLSNEYLHQIIGNNRSLFQFLIFFIALLPIPYMTYKAISLLTMIRIAKLTTPITQKIAEQKLDNKIFRPKETKK